MAESKISLPGIPFFSFLPPHHFIQQQVLFLPHGTCARAYETFPFHISSSYPILKNKVIYEFAWHGFHCRYNYY